MATSSLPTASVNSPPAATGSVTVNAAFFQEIKEVHQELWRSLDRVTALSHQTERPSEFYQQLLLQLDEAHDFVGLHFQLEESYGYFEDPVYVDSRFCSRASQLRSEHQKLYWQLTRIVEWAARLMQNDRLEASVETLWSRFAAFCDQFREHETREIELIMDAFSDETGCVD